MARRLAFQYWPLAPDVLEGRPSHRLLALLPRRYGQFTPVALMESGLRGMPVPQILERWIKSTRGEGSF